MEQDPMNGPPVGKASLKNQTVEHVEGDTREHPVREGNPMNALSVGKASQRVPLSPNIGGVTSVKQHTSALHVTGATVKSGILSSI